MPSQFCQYIGTTGKEFNTRCVAKRNHEPAPHDLMSRSSGTVRMIERQEELDRRLGDSDPVAKVADELDRVVEKEAEPSKLTNDDAAASPKSSAETTASETTRPATAAESAADPA